MAYTKQNFTDGQVLNANHLNHIEEGIVNIEKAGGSGSGGAQSDWNAAEGEPGHILNRTHWMEKGFAEMFPETTVVLSNGEGALMKPIGLVAGEVYEVTYNGTKYTCTAIEMPMGDGPTLTLVGNAVAGGGADTGEPFMLAEIPADYVEAFGCNAMIGDLNGASTCTFSIASMQDVARKIPHEYIPNSDWNAAKKESGHILNRTHYAEIVNVDFSMEDAFVYGGYFIEPIIIAVGNTYTVTWNGVEYPCTAKYWGRTLVLGDVGGVSGGTSTGEPFLISIYEEADENGAYGQIYALDGSASASISVKGETEQVHKLDAKYLDMNVVASLDAVDFTSLGAVEFGSYRSVDLGDACTEQFRKGFGKITFSVLYKGTTRTFTVLLNASDETHGIGTFLITEEYLLCFVSVEILTQGRCCLTICPAYTKKFDTTGEPYKSPVVCDGSGNFYGIKVNASGNLEAYAL